MRTTQVFLEPHTRLHLIKTLPPPVLLQENRHNCEWGEAVCGLKCAEDTDGCVPRERILPPWSSPLTAPARILVQSSSPCPTEGVLTLCRPALSLAACGLVNECVCQHGRVCWVGKGGRGNSLETLNHGERNTTLSWQLAL